MAAALRKYWLTLLVHADAFRFEPAGYCQALLWRLRGFRLRSRNRFAALMGRSRHAYALWIARTEPRVHAAILREQPDGHPSILPVVVFGESIVSADARERSMGTSEVPGSVALAGRPTGSRSSDGERATQLADLVTSQGSWLCIVNMGDRLAANALEIYARAAACNPERWIIYADDDLIARGARSEPHFKSDWNPELFEHHDFITGSAIVRVTPEMVRALPTPLPRDWPAAVVREALKRGAPLHLPVVLHHRIERPKPSVPRLRALARPPAAPLVSVIVPTRNRLSLLRACVEGVKRTAYPQSELIVVNNDSDDRDTLRYLKTLEGQGVKVLNVPGPFNFSALNNFAAEQASGELLCFLNNDVEIIDDDWLALLVRQAMKDDIGAVGGRLLYPDRTIQHAGVVTGVGGGAAHAHRYEREEETGYFLRHRLPQRVSAVTAACLVVAKRKFLVVGGFNQEDFPVAFNDVDLCLKLNARGWQSFYEPRAVLIHHESKSRGSDSAKENRARFAEELAALKRHWGTDRLRDPYHHPHLSPFCERFYIAL